MKSPKTNPAERDVLKGILALLKDVLIWPAFRSNAGAGTRPRKDGGFYTIRCAPEDWPDITGMIPGAGDGRMLVIEAKAPGERPDAGQVATMRAINDAGGCAFWTDDVGDCYRTLLRLRAGYRVEMQEDGTWCLQERGGR